MRIVIADDSSTARMFARRCLEVLGYQDADIIEVENGVKALSAVLVKETDLLLTDLTMPNMDGMQLVKIIAEDEVLQNLKLIVITSAGNSAKEKILSGYGAAVISKPVSPAKLAPILEQKLAPVAQEESGEDDTWAADDSHSEDSWGDDDDWA